MASEASPILPRAGSVNVDVSIVDCGDRIKGVKTSTFMEPIIPQYHAMDDLPAFSFLVQHPTKGNYLFDLGLRKDIDNVPPSLLAMVRGEGWTVELPSDVADTLSSNAFDLESVKGIIWSHWHWDHTGDPNTFPNSTDLIVGPGFRASFDPAYPTVKDSPVDERAWSTRNLIEIEFHSDDKIAGLKAHDFFGNGSFYLLDSPGHAIGHLMALARTTSDSFILMGADTCHHPGHFRPSTHRHLPDPAPCPGEMLTRAHPRPDRVTTEPFYTYPSIPDGTGVAHSREDALTTRESLMQLDADARVLVILAHDATILRCDKIQFFPHRATGWKSQGWKEDVQWTFLQDFAAEA